MPGENGVRVAGGAVLDGQDAGATVAWAHYTKDGRAHALVDHLRAVAEGAGRFATKFHAEQLGRLAGLWHDLGKYSGDFQAMIRRENGVDAHIEVEGGPRDHSTAGACHAYQLGVVGVPLAFVIAGHHAGLADLHTLRERLAKKASLRDAVLLRSPPADIVEPDLIRQLSDVDPASHVLDRELQIRLLFSALCDADFLDTEAFYQPANIQKRAHAVDLRTLLSKLHAHLDRVTRSDTEVNRARSDVRSASMQAAPGPPGVFTLTVPTGGGKTLASMLFALEHAVAHGLDRVVVAIPFTSILEQNAGVYRDIFGTDAVIEHHSALDPDKESYRNRIVSENWDAPIVVTTTVQLFESLLASRPRACRKLHNLVRSVIVLDEAQSLPGTLLPVILDILGRLSRSHRTSIVVSTATQPALGRSPTLTEGFEASREICGPELRLFDRLRRVRVHWPSSTAPTPYKKLASTMAHDSRALAVVHRRKDAAELCRLIDEELGHEETFHLSALMTPVHRRQTLEHIRRTLALADREIRLVATQLIEAGVDVDFPVVYRAFAGLDSLAQAAGRCNREGRLSDLGELRVFFAETPPPPGTLRQAMDIARTLWTADPALDLFAPTTHARFFAQLYQNTDLARGRDLQKKRAEFQFRTVDRGDDTQNGFAMITNDWSAPLIIVHDDRAAALVAELEAAGPSRALSRRLQQFIVNVPKKALSEWLRRGAVRTVGELATVLDRASAQAAYDVRFGLMLDRVGWVDPNYLIQ